MGVRWQRGKFIEEVILTTIVPDEWLPDVPLPHRVWDRAGNGTRTRDINLGKVALYQLSYSRKGGKIY